MGRAHLVGPSAGNDDPLRGGLLLRSFGQTEKALECMEEAVRFGTIQKKWLEHDPDLRSIRGHPRFQALLARL